MASGAPSGPGSVSAGAGRPTASERSKTVAAGWCAPEQGNESRENGQTIAEHDAVPLCDT